jgi:prefoldin subunit 2
MSQTELTDEREIIARFQQIQDHVRTLAGRLNEIEGDETEHEGVLKLLEPLDGDRKCFRLIGGVLVERTVADVKPALKDSRDRLKGVSGFASLYVVTSGGRQCTLEAMQ